MPTETTYTALRENLASYLDRVVDDREVLVVKRRGARDVAFAKECGAAAASFESCKARRRQG